MQTYKVLSIDAWGNQEDGYDWNQWFNAGTVEIPDNATDADVLSIMESSGFITSATLGDIEDDQYNWIVVDKASREPIFAIEYGSLN